MDDNISNAEQVVPATPDTTEPQSAPPVAQKPLTTLQKLAITLLAREHFRRNEE